MVNCKALRSRGVYNSSSSPISPHPPLPTYNTTHNAQPTTTSTSTPLDHIQPQCKHQLLYLHISAKHQAQLNISKNLEMSSKPNPNANCTRCRKPKRSCNCIPGTLYAPGGFSGPNWDRNSPCFEDDDKLQGSAKPKPKPKSACSNCKQMIESRPCAFCRK
jgi:hypothetical protein